MYNTTSHVKEGPSWFIVDNYSDIQTCVEISAVYDDSLKKNEVFTKYAIMVAQEIAGKRAIVSWGKWGARLELESNSKKHSLVSLTDIAQEIITHPSWLGLFLSTHVFTYKK